MASVEIIGLLCAGSTRYHDQGSRSSGKNNLSKSELAGLLAGLDRMAMNLAFAKYAGDLEAERMLIAQMRVWAAGVAVRESWKILKGVPSLCNMSAIVVFEVVRPNRCNRCYGRGVLVNKSCHSCGGTGYHHLSGRQIAEAIGVSEGSYRQTWKERYEYAFNHLQDIDSKIKRALYKATKEQEQQTQIKKVIATYAKCEYVFP